MIIQFKKSEYTYTPKKFRKGWRIVVTDNVTGAKFMFDSAWYTKDDAIKKAKVQALKDSYS